MIKFLQNRTVQTKCCEPPNKKCDEDDDDTDERKFTLKIKATTKSENNKKDETTQTNANTTSYENHSGRTRVEYTRRQHSETAAIDENYYEHVSDQLPAATNGISTERNLSYGVQDRRANRRLEPSNQNTVCEYY